MRNRSKLVISPHHLQKIRLWERNNLPCCVTEAGYFLILELAKSDKTSNVALKEFYLSMPFAESTVRLLLRDLENDGWLVMQSLDKDKRIKRFLLTDKFCHLREEWLHEIQKIISE